MCLAVKFLAEARFLFSSHLVAFLSLLETLMEIHRSPSLSFSPSLPVALAAAAWGCLHGRPPALCRRVAASAQGAPISPHDSILGNAFQHDQLG